MAGLSSAWLLLAVPCLASPAPESFQTAVQPFIAKNCVACHNDKQQSGGLNLKASADVQKDCDQWERVVEN
jgi:hypothetical protein